MTIDQMKTFLIENGDIPQGYIDQIIDCLDEEAGAIIDQVYNFCHSEASFWKEIAVVAESAREKVPLKTETSE